MPPPTRRAVLAAGLAAVTAGCASGPDRRTTSQDGGATGSTVGGGRQPGDHDLDLREANVVAVKVTAEGDRYSFDVTLHHDDEGEAGYADWWQVERLDGRRLGRRDLLHPHADQPFTRSDSYRLPGDVDCVVVRGHDQTHGYGGRAMLVSLESGTTRPVDQGGERRPVEPVDCPS